MTTWRIIRAGTGWAILYPDGSEHSVWANITDARKCLYWAQRAEGR